MAWLNLNHDLQYDFDTMLVGMLEVPEDEILYHPLGGFPLEVINCDMPFRAHMKNHSNWWGYRGSERTKHGLNTWAFIDYVIEANIDKSFSQAFSYFCKFVNPQYQKYFLERFNNYNTRSHWGGYWGKYWIDSNDIIRAKENRDIKRWKSNKKGVFMSHDYEETWLLEKTQNVYKKNWKTNSGKIVSQSYTYTETFRRGISKRYIDGFHQYYPECYIKAVELKSTKGYKEEFENDRVSKYKRLRHEDIKRTRKIEREANRKKKEIVYSFLTKEEIKLKEEKERDIYSLYRHGFDDDSFKGEHYHGRKNKKK